MNTCPKEKLLSPSVEEREDRKSGIRFRIQRFVFRSTIAHVLCANINILVVVTSRQRPLRTIEQQKSLRR